MNQIKDLDELLRDYIGPNKTVISKDVTSLTGPGENYMSEMQKIKVVVKNKENESTEVLNMVAKCTIEIPGMGNTAHMSNSEIQFYRNVIPNLYKFQERHGVPKSTFFPKVLGARLNLTGEKDADLDAVILLENLKEQGYVNVDRYVGFNLSQAKHIFGELASFHSTFLAFKLLEPEIFKKDVESYFGSGFPPPPKDGTGPPLPPFGHLHEVILQYLKTDESCTEVIPKVEKLVKRLATMMEDPMSFFNKPPVEPFCTVVHKDMWLNNTMQILQDGEIVDNKFLDFQMCKKDSLANDFIFFLFSSVQSDVLAKNFDSLCEHYYEVFSNTLKLYNCHDDRFSYEKLLNEIKENSLGAIQQCLMMVTCVIFGKKGQKFDFEKLSELRVEDLTPLAKERLSMLILKAAKREWI